jgi:hypothetical protein
MQQSTAGVLERLLDETQQTEPELMALVFRTGLRQVWREHVLGRYLRGEIEREEAAEAVGLDWVELAERQRDAALDDVDWALGT